jgi:hypothetical protein
MNPDGTITVAAGTTSGTYTYPYEIWEILNPTNCATAEATVVAETAPIVAEDDDLTGTPINGQTGGPAGYIFTDNGSGPDNLNGATIDPALTTISVTNERGLTGVTIADDGPLTVPAGTPADTYAVTYQLCEDLNPANCDDAIVTVLVNPPLIDAQDDDLTGTPVNGAAGGAAGNVYADNGSGTDTLGGSATGIAGLTSITILDDGGLASVSIADDGTISVPAGTAANTYTIEYQLCEDLNPTNCDTAIATVHVDAAAIAAEDDDLSAAPVSSVAGGIGGNIYADNGSGTDTLNGSATGIVGLTTIAVTDAGGLAGVAIADNGDMSVPPNPPGRHLYRHLPAV